MVVISYDSSFFFFYKLANILVCLGTELCQTHMPDSHGKFTSYLICLALDLGFILHEENGGLGRETQTGMHKKILILFLDIKQRCNILSHAFHTVLQLCLSLMNLNLRT